MQRQTQPTQPTPPNCGSRCEKVTGSNVINVLRGGGALVGEGGSRSQRFWWGMGEQEPKIFC